MHGSTSIFQIGPVNENYHRVDAGTVYPSRLKIEIPANTRYIHKVLLSWKIEKYKSSVEGGAETLGHNHTGAAGSGGAFTPAVSDGGAHTPTELSKAHSHDVDVDLNMVLTSTTGYLPTAKAVSTENSHTHPKGSTGGPDDVTDAVVGLTTGCSCSEACGGGHCITGTVDDGFAQDTHYHLNTGLSTGVGTSHGHDITTHTGSRPYLTDIQLGLVGSATEDPAHAHTINSVADHPHTGIAEPAHSDHTIVTEGAADVDLTYGVYEEAAGTLLELIINGETVGSSYSGDQTDIVISGFLTTGSNTVLLQPVSSEVGKKGSATFIGTGLVFIEAKKW